MSWGFRTGSFLCDRCIPDDMNISLAIGNGAGRIVAGMLSDKLGRKAIKSWFLAVLGIAIFALYMLGVNELVLLFGTAAFLLALTFVRYPRGEADLLVPGGVSKPGP